MGPEGAAWRRAISGAGRGGPGSTAVHCSAMAMRMDSGQACAAHGPPQWRGAAWRLGYRTGALGVKVGVARRGATRQGGCVRRIVRCGACGHGPPCPAPPPRSLTLRHTHTHTHSPVGASTPCRAAAGAAGRRSVTQTRSSQRCLSAEKYLSSLGSHVDPRADAGNRAGPAALAALAGLGWGGGSPEDLPRDRWAGAWPAACPATTRPQ